MIGGWYVRRMVESLSGLSDKELQERALAELRVALDGVPAERRWEEAQKRFGLVRVGDGFMAANPDYSPTPAMWEIGRRRAEKREAERAEREARIASRPLVLPGWREMELTATGSRCVSAMAYVAAAVLVFVVLAVALWSCRGPADLPAPCDSLTLGQLTVECRARVRAECSRDGGVVDESCGVLRECDRRIAAWKACADGGVGIGAGGSP